jgi:rubrerythrin
MYPTYRAVAAFQGEKSAEITFTWAWEAEKTHLDLYQKAKQSVDNGKDPVLGSIHICEVCGYTVEGAVPEICPICNAKKERFRAFEK